MRDHQPIVIEDFNGLYQRGGADSCPPDHFPDCENIRYVGTSEFASRYGIGLHQDVLGPLGSILRIYNYITQDKNTLLVLVKDGADGKIYHVVDSVVVFGPVLTITGMTDFGFFPYAGRAYITPFTTYGTSPNQQEKGMQNQFLYVYLGDGTNARKAAGVPPTAGALTIVNGAGATDAGFHLFGVAYETDTGYITAPARFTGFTTVAANGVSISNIPISPSTAVVARRIVITKVIPTYNGDDTGYQYFFLPSGRIADNVSTTLNNVTFFDADLLEDASHLIDNYSEIPAGVGLTLYHGRMCLYTTYTDISLILVSEVGEPEAISQIDGLIVAPLDGNPITNGQEMRDVLYIFKRNRTLSYVDNGDAPSSWPLTVIDYGLGCPVHGIATVIDSGAASADFLLIATYRGVMIFNGKYAEPELSWDIKDYWDSQDRNLFRRIQVINDTVGKQLYLTLPSGLLLNGDYGNGLDPEKIRWAPLRFDVTATTIAFININTLIMGSEITLFGA